MAPPAAAGPRRPADVLRRALFSRQARRIWGLGLALMTAAVLVLALSPASQVAVPGWDKANHSVAFMALGFTALFALRERVRATFWVGFGLLALGVGIELVQVYVPGRSADMLDIVADTVGIVIGLGAAHGLARRMDRRTHPRHGPDAGPSSMMQRASQPPG